MTDVCGGVNIKNHYGDQALSVFIQAPSVEVLRERPKKRSGCARLKHRVEKSLNGVRLAAWAAKLERSGVFDGEAKRDGKTPWSETKQRMPPAWACAVAGD